MTIIQKYLAVEVLKSSLASILILFVILLSNGASAVLSDIALGEAPSNALLPLMMSQSTSLLTVLLPFGLFLGIMFAFGRLYKDYEMTVLNSCGFGYKQMLVPVSLVILPLFILSLFISTSFNANTQRYAQSIVNQHENKNEFEQILPGKFNVSKSGDLVFYMESMSDDRKHLNNIIIHNQEGDIASIEIAEKGFQVKNNETDQLFLDVGPGIRYQGKSNTLEYSITQYQTHGLLLDLESKNSKKKIKRKEKPLSLLWDSKNRRDRIELQWRFATSIALVVLALLAIPLSYIPPRKGRYGKMGAAILVYILYSSLLGAVLAWMEKGKVPIDTGFWFVHLGFLVLTLLLLLKRNRGVII